MLAMEQIRQKRSALDHTSKEDYFLKFRKDDFDGILLIYGTLTLQRIFTFFPFHLHKSLEQQEPLSLFHTGENRS